MKEKNNQKKQDAKRSKKINNYVTLIIIFLACIGLVLYISKLYTLNEEEQRKVPEIQGVLSEIYQEDLEHYVLDTPQAVVYMCTAPDEECRSFERKFKKLLKKKDNYANQIIYLNLTDIDQENFIDSFNNRYQYKAKLTNEYPAFVIFEDGKLTRILQGSKNKPLTISKVKQFLEINKIGELGE